MSVHIYLMIYSLAVSSKVKHEFSMHPSDPLLGICTNTYVCTKTRTGVFLAAFLIIAKRWK